MNKLEQEIEEGKNTFSGFFARQDGFKQGAQFILDKNLTVQFTDWYLENEHEEELHDIFLESTEFIYDYWINNVYGL